jgi:hypothetical protein
LSWVRKGTDGRSPVELSYRARAWPTAATGGLSPLFERVLKILDTFADTFSHFGQSLRTKKEEDENQNNQ